MKRVFVGLVTLLHGLAHASIPFSVFVFESAHPIMQRGMLRGVRDRADGQLRG